LAYSCKVGPSSSLTIDSSLLLFLWRILLVNEVNVLITLLGVYVTSRPPASAALPWHLTPFFVLKYAWRREVG